MFRNSFGTIDLEFVFFEKLNKKYEFKKISYIELKHQKIYLYVNIYYVQLIFTNATSRIIEIKIREIEDVKLFVNFFSKLRSLNPELD
jgi:hypothetical protein